MREAACRWRTIEHTADLAVEVEAPTPERLFEASAHALTGVLLGAEAGALEAEPQGATDWRNLALEAPDREALLVDWLRELLYVQTTEDLVLRAAEVEQLEATRLVARAGFAVPSDDRPVERELKGVTYHDLAFERRGAGWFARIVFDL